MDNKQIWPGWETQEMLGAGGFSEVYKIRKADESGDFFSALKVISIPKSKAEYHAYRSDGYDDDSITQMFRSQVDDIVKEFKMMSRFRGTTNVVSYEDHMIVPKDDGMGWDVLIRMELLTTLSERYASAPLGEQEVIKLGTDICTALVLCEKYNIVHRDIKPQNIFLNDFGDYKLGDFGIARAMDHATHATKIGTVSYMAPEVYRGDAYDSTADICSLGLTLYWLLNERRLPFIPLPPTIPSAAETAEAYTRRLSGEELPKPKNGSDELKEIVLKACAFNPADRFQTAAEFGAALASLMGNGNKFSPVIMTADDTPINEEMTFGAAAFGSEATTVIEETTVLENNETVVLDADPASTSAKEEEDSEDGKKKKWLLLLLLLLLLALVIGLLAWAIGGDDDNGDTVTTTTTTNTTQTTTTTTQTTTTEQTTTIDTTPVQITGVLVDTLPAKTVYYVGDTFDYSGLSLKLTYSDGSTKIVNEGFIFENITLKSAGEHTVTVSYAGQQTTIKVTVKKVDLESVSIVGYPNTYYVVGQSLDTSGLALKLVYSNGKEEVVTSGFTCTPTKFTASGKIDVKVTYGSKESKFTVTVSDIAVESVSIKSAPTKTNYYVGDSLDTSGLALTVKYNNGKTETITSGFSCTPSVFNNDGNVVVAVNYGGKSADFTVKVDKVYTVNWNTGTGYTIIVKRTSSPNAGASTGTLKSGAKVYNGDVLSVTYTASTGYTITTKGAASVTVKGNVTASDIYATAKVNSYTVSWSGVAEWTAVVTRIESPHANASLGTLTSVSTVYYGDVLSVKYTSNTGYTLTGTGETSIIVTGNVTSSTIYATAKVNSYTATWSSGTGYTVTVSRTSSPKAGAATGTINSGTTVYYGDVLSVNYTANTGFTLVSTGASSITVTGNVPSNAIDASVKVNSYTVSWSGVAGWTAVVTRTSSPYANASTGTLTSVSTVYYGDVLSVKYTANTGYTLTGTGYTSVTVTGNVTSSTIYATAKVNSYTATWSSGTGYTITVKRTSSPNAGASTGTIYSGTTVYYGDVLSVTYTKNDYYTLTSYGATSITVRGNVTSSDIYASATFNSVSGWVLESNVPSGAQIVNTKWTYTRTQTTESTSSSMSGWTQTGSYWTQTGSGSFEYSDKFSTYAPGFDTSHSIYSMAKAPYSAYENETTKRTVSTSWAGYIYWHWMYDCGGAKAGDRVIFYQKGSGSSSLTGNSYNYKYFGAFKSSTDYTYVTNSYKQNNTYYKWYKVTDRSSNADSQGTLYWYRFDYYICNYVDYQRIYQYKMVTTGIESSTSVSAGGEISNVQKWVQYRAK